MRSVKTKEQTRYSGKETNSDKDSVVLELDKHID